MQGVNYHLVYVIVVKAPGTDIGPDHKRAPARGDKLYYIYLYYIKCFYTFQPPAGSKQEAVGLAAGFRGSRISLKNVRPPLKKIGKNRSKRLGQEKCRKKGREQGVSRALSGLMIREPTLG